MAFRKKLTLALAVVFVLFIFALGAAYRYITTGGLIARQKPPAVEASVTRWALRTSVPESAKKLQNPLAAHTPASENVSAGQELYKQKCETCHGYDGSGKTEAGSGLYPPPLDLRGSEVKNATDGGVLYFIRNGIRNIAMPGWQLPDQDTWRLVVFIRNLPKFASLSARTPAVALASSSLSAS